MYAKTIDAHTRTNTQLHTNSHINTLEGGRERENNGGTEAGIGGGREGRRREGGGKGEGRHDLRGKADTDPVDPPKATTAG